MYMYMLHIYIYIRAMLYVNKDRVRGEILASVKHLLLAVVFARWKAHGDARARGNGVGPNDVAGREGRHRGEHAFACIYICI